MLEEGYRSKHEGNVKVKHTVISQTTVTTPTAKKKSQETIPTSTQTALHLNVPPSNPTSSFPASLARFSTTQGSGISSSNSGTASRPRQSARGGKGGGIFACLQGDIYFGHWQGNLLKMGVCLFRNGEGFEEGKQGFGTYFYPNDNVYSGDWLNDVKHCQGKIESPTGTTTRAAGKGAKRMDKAVTATPTALSSRGLRQRSQRGSCNFPQRHKGGGNMGEDPR